MPRSPSMDVLDLSTLRQRLSAQPLDDTRADTVPAAVASILRAGPDGPELLFIRRAERVGDPWSGDLAFPGGKREVSDASLYDAAVRETREEVGIELRPAMLAARLADVEARRSGYRVAQFVFTLDEPQAAVAATAEVAGTIWRPLVRLARQEGAGTYLFAREGMTSGSPLELPCLRFDGQVLWGMTYRMVMQLLDALSLRAGEGASP